MIVLLLLLSTAIFAFDLIKAIVVTQKVVDLTEQQRVLLSKAAQFNKDAAKLTSPSTFAQCAKLQRMAIFNEKQAEKLGTQQALTKTHWLCRVAPAKLAICLIVTVSLWRQSVAHIDSADTWPLTQWLSGFTNSGHNLHGTVAAAPCIAITQVVSNALVKIAVPESWQ